LSFPVSLGSFLVGITPAPSGSHLVGQDSALQHIPIRGIIRLNIVCSESAQSARFLLHRKRQCCILPYLSSLQTTREPLNFDGFFSGLDRSAHAVITFQLP
jgi:hypothetical protein